MKPASQLEQAYELRQLVSTAYDLEAELLNDHDLAAWSQWLHPDFTYEVPIGVTRDDPGVPQYSDVGRWAMETRSSIQLWVERLSDRLVEVAYAENPPIRTRHFISGVRVRPLDSSGELHVRSNVMLTWCRGSEAPRFIAGERRDILIRGEEDDLLLRSRQVLLDANVIHLSHLRVIL